MRSEMHGKRLESCSRLLQRLDQKDPVKDKKEKVMQRDRMKMSCAWLFCVSGMSQTDRHISDRGTDPPELTEWSDRSCNRRNPFRQQCSKLLFLLHLHRCGALCLSGPLLLHLS